MKKFYWSLRKFIKRRPGSAIAIIGTAVLFTAGAIIIRNQAVFYDQVNALGQNNPRLFNAIKVVIKLSDIPFRLTSLLVPDRLERYELSLDPQDLDRLNQNLPQGLGTNLTEEYKKTVPATFIFEGREYPVKVRYRGDNRNHWAFAKKSWRINFTDEPFRNFTSIDLIIPEDRGYFQELTMAFIAQKLGLTVPQMQLVNLFVNGKRHGVYLAAEHWSPAFLESRGQAATNNLYGENEFTGFSRNIYYSSAQLKKFHSDEKSDLINFAEVEIITQALREPSGDAFLQKAVQLIDIENFLRWQAHATLMFSRSQRDTHNIILNFNSQTGKFEFIPWNVSMILKDVRFENINFYENTLMARVLENDHLYAQRNQILWNFVKDTGNLQDVLEFINRSLRQARFDVYKDPLRRFTVLEMEVSTSKFKRQFQNTFDRIKQELIQGQVAIYVTINPREENYRSTIAYIDIENSGFSPTAVTDLTVEFAATPSASVALYLDTGDKNFTSDDTKLGELSHEGWKINDARAVNKIELDDLIIATRTKRLNSKGELQDTPVPQRRQRLFLVSTGSLQLVDLKAKTKNAATNEKTKPYAIRLVDDATFRYLEHINRSRDEFLSDNPIFRADPKQDNRVILPTGVYTISQTIIVPNTVELTIQPGVTLRFNQAVSMISYGQVTAIGTRNQPITLTASSAVPWGVFGVVGKKASDSEFGYVTVEQASEAYINGIYFTGGLAVHYADVKVRSSTFRNNTGDDGLNIKHAQTEIYDSQFIGNQFDGLDLDVVTGEIKDNIFSANGNDGLDLSYSDVLIEKNQIDSSSDKCVSIGEKSRPTVINNTIFGCNIGIAVKDLSEVRLSQNIIKDNAIAVAAYQKKPIFGGATVIFGDNTLINNLTDFDISSNSILTHANIQ